MFVDDTKKKVKNLNLKTNSNHSSKSGQKSF